MNTKLLGIFFLAGALSAPAFAGNTASNAPFTSFPGASTKSRTEVKIELASAVQDKTLAPEGNHIDPSNSAVARQTPATRTTALAQGNGLSNRERP